MSGCCKSNIPKNVQFMFKRKSGNGSVFIFVMKWRQTCGTMRWEDGPQNISIPHPPKGKQNKNIPVYSNALIVIQSL